VLANVIGLAAIEMSHKPRSGVGLWVAELVATIGLIAAIFALARTGRAGSWTTLPVATSTASGRSATKSNGASAGSSLNSQSPSAPDLREIDPQLASRATAVANASRSGNPVASASCTRTSSISS
jgi:hypothetical protein